MGYITDVQLNRKKKRVSVFIDHSFSFTVDKEIAFHAGLCTGKEMPADEIEQIKRSDRLQDCLNAALHFLEYRPRSEAEVRQRLRRRGFTEETIDEVIVSLKQQLLIDDQAFAQYWKDNRLSFRPRGKNLIKRELLQKGISYEMAADIVDEVNDEESAYSVAQKKARILAALEYTEFRNRLWNFLRRKGYSYEVIDSVILRLWQNKENI